jgi:hypothetical protein
MTTHRYACIPIREEEAIYGAFDFGVIPANLKGKRKRKRNGFLGKTPEMRLE